MRYNKLILPVVFSLCLLPLGVARSTAAAAEPGAQGFKILLSDGTIVKGAVSFTLNLDTPYGRLAVPSTNFISGDFDPAGGWASIRTQAVQLRVQYKLGTSDLEATTDVGPVNVDLAKVVSVRPLYPEVPNATVAASNPYTEANQAAAQPPDIYPQPEAYYNPAPYDYAAAAPYYEPPYYPTAPFSYASEYPYCWQPGLGFIVISNFDRGFGFSGHHHERFGNDNHRERFDNEFESHNFHVAWNGNRPWHSAATSGFNFNRAASVSPAASGRSFSAATFHSAPSGSFAARTAPTFRSAPISSFRSGGMSISGGGFSHSSGFSHSGGFGGFAHAGGFGGRR